MREVRTIQGFVALEGEARELMVKRARELRERILAVAPEATFTEIYDEDLRAPGTEGGRVVVVTDEKKDRRILTVGGRIIPPLPPGKYDVVVLGPTGRTPRAPHIVPLHYPREPVGGPPLLDADYDTLEHRLMVELRTSPLELPEARIREDWLRHWPAARDFIRLAPEEKTPQPDVALLAGLSVEVRRIRRRRR